MGFFDFLNPKKAIEKKMSAAVEGKIGPKLAEIKGMKDKAARRRKLEEVVQAEMRSQANQVIPGPLQKHSATIINNASKTLVDKLEAGMG